MRVCAALLLVAWVSAASTCALESAFGHTKAGDEHQPDQADHHQNDAAPSPGSSGHSHDSDKNGGDDNHFCCSSLNATAQIPNSTFLNKPDFGKALWLPVLWSAQALALDQPETPISRRPPDREWTFMPEVCLGPAFRSHAPPLAV
jgi:hypothetical protein